MLRNLSRPRPTFRPRSECSRPGPSRTRNGNDPTKRVLKPSALCLTSRPPVAAATGRVWIGLSPSEPNPENAVKDLVSFLPVLAFDGANMTQIDAGGILDIAMAGTSATLLARKWNPASGERGQRHAAPCPGQSRSAGRRGAHRGLGALGDNIIETIITRGDGQELRTKPRMVT